MNLKMGWEYSKKIIKFIRMFEVELPVNTDPIDTTSISTQILYFSEVELAEFKQLCKIGMSDAWQDKSRANVSDFLLKLLRQTYGKNNL